MDEQADNVEGLEAQTTIELQKLRALAVQIKAKRNRTKITLAGQTDSIDSSLLEQNTKLLQSIAEMLMLEACSMQLVRFITNDSSVSLPSEHMRNIEHLTRQLRQTFIQLQKKLQEENALLENERGDETSIRNAKLQELLSDEAQEYRTIAQIYISIYRQLKDFMNNQQANLPLISIIIPAYNEQKSIEKTLRSLQRQTYPNKEIIVVVNGSTDNTHEVAARYTGSVYRIQTRGVAVSKNYGASVSKGAILVFFDADTLAYKDLLQGIHESMRQGFNCGKVIDLRAVRTGVREGFLRWLRYAQAKVQQKTNIPLSGGGACMFCEREVFFKIGGFDEKLLTSEDTDLTKRLIKAGRFKYFDEGFIYTSMRRFEKKGYMLTIFADLIMGIFPTKIDRDWIR